VRQYDKIPRLAFPADSLRVLPDLVFEIFTVDLRLVHPEKLQKAGTVGTRR